MDIRGPQRFEGPCAAAVGAGDIAVHVDRFIDEARPQPDLLQRRQHRRITATQLQRLQFIDTFAQLAKHLLESIEKALALGVHLCALALLHLLQGNTDAAGKQHSGAGQRRQRGQHPGTVKKLAQRGNES
ncbi:hypothetical protein D3C76_528830 [compost metagenome]